MRHGTLKKRLLALAVGLVLLLGSLVPTFAAGDVSLNKESITITSGKTYQLKVTVNGVTAKATWKSSNTSVATVNGSGLVTGKAAGSAVITASINGKKLECLVSVLKKTTNTTYRYNVLILDASGSMKGKPTTSQKLAAKRFCKKVLSTEGKNYVAVIALNAAPKTLCGFTNKYSTLERYINSINPKGDTNVNQALSMAQKLLNNVSKKGSAVMKNIVLCSDGLPTVGTALTSGKYKVSDYKDYRYANAAYATASKIKKQDHFIYALGFFHKLKGKELSFGKRFMKDIASKDKYFIIQDSNDLNEVFDNIANQITKTTMNKTSITLEVGKTYQLRALVNGVSKKASWSSSSSSIASVNSSGKVTARNVGTTTIKATVNGKSVTCKVKVIKKKYPEGAFQWNGHTYMIYNASCTWTEAKAKCEKEGGHLVTVTSKAENDMLTERVANNQKKLYWIGLRREDAGKAWKWVTGERVDYVNWAYNEPNNDQSKNEKYVHLFGVKYTGGVGTKYIGEWNDAINNGANYASSFYNLNNFGYICEWDNK